MAKSRKYPKDDTPPCVEYASNSTMNLAAGIANTDFAEGLELLDVSLDIKKVGRELENYIRNRKTKMEERMFERFYVMRIEQSRKFIDLISRINKSWDDFVGYLKLIGAQGASGDGECTVYSLTNNSSSLTAMSQFTNRSK